MRVLMIDAGEAADVTPMLELTGYAEPVPGRKGAARGRKGAWRNTQSGDTVAGSKPPVPTAIASLKHWRSCECGLNR
jgi:hypothetical protein